MSEGGIGVGPYGFSGSKARFLRSRGRFLGALALLLQRIEWAPGCIWGTLARIWGLNWGENRRFLVSRANSVRHDKC